MINGDDSRTPQPINAVRTPANRELVVAIGNLHLEAHQHAIGLKSIYEAIRDWDGTAPKSWGMQLVEEMDRHIARQQLNTGALKSVVG